MVKDIKFLTVQDILQAKDIEYEVCEAWSGKLNMKGLTGKERQDWEYDFINVGAKKNQSAFNLRVNMKASLVARSACDASGKRIFTDDQIVQLATKSAKELSKAYDVAARLSGITEDDFEELEKNSDATQGDDSPLD